VSTSHNCIPLALPPDVRHFMREGGDDGVIGAPGKVLGGEITSGPGEQIAKLRGWYKSLYRSHRGP
jgi:hypothetical protein